MHEKTFRLLNQFFLTSVISAVCDMFLARASMLLFESSVTRHFSTYYRAPVPLMGVCSMVVSDNSNAKKIRAQAFDEDAMLLFECEGSFVARSSL